MLIHMNIQQSQMGRETQAQDFILGNNLLILALGNNVQAQSQVPEVKVKPGSYSVNCE